MGETWLVVGDIIGSNHRKCARPNFTLPHFETWTTHILQLGQTHSASKTNTLCNLKKYIWKCKQIHFTIWIKTESAADLILLFSHLRRALIGLLHSDHYYWVVSIFLIDCFLLVKVLLLQLTQKKWA